jgi:colanic acid/amylovoran biosynthesis glycosyltransferase
MPKVAVFSTNFLDYSQTFVYEEITHHTRYQVEVFCRARKLTDRFPFSPVHVGGALYGVTRESPAFHRVFRKQRFDLIHGHFGTGSVYAVPYAARYKLPLVVTFHGYDVPLLRSAARLYPVHWPYALFARGMLERLTMGLCASRELYELLAEVGVPRERLRIHHLGIDLGAFRRGPRRALPRVVMVGRFVEKKGFEYGIRAFARALARGARGELVIAGGGERQAALEALVREQGIERHARFAGVLPSREVAQLLAESDVLLAPSVVDRDGDRESGVIAIKEASACELAVIGTYHGGIPEIIDDGETGYLVPERDVESLADRLYRTLMDRARTESMGKAGRAKMQREYDLPAKVEELEQHYDEALALGPR